MGTCPQAGSVLPEAVPNGLGVSSFALKLVPAPHLEYLADLLEPEIGAPAGHCRFAGPHAAFLAHGRSVSQDLL